MSIVPQLSRIVLMVRGSQGLAKAVEFYHGAVGLPVMRVTDEWAELSLGGGNIGSGATPTTVLSLQAVENESQLGNAYSPVLTFQVADMDTVISNCVQNGGHLDGPIQYPAHGKVAALRAPDGQMIGLYEPNIT